MYGLATQTTITTAAASEPITTAEAKAHLRVDIADDDTLIDTYIEAARQIVEADTGRALVDRTYRLDLPAWHEEIVLPFPPLVSVSSVKYYDASESLQTLGTDNYQVDIPGRRIVQTSDATIPSSWDRIDAWQVTFVAGYGTTNSPQGTIPEALLTAIKMYVADFYELREPHVIGLNLAQNPAVDRLLGPYRARL